MIYTSVKGDISLRKQIKALALSARKKRQINVRLGKQVIKASKERIKKQITVDGGAFTKRKGRKKKRMLTRLMKSGQMGNFANSEQTTVTWKNSRAGKTARAQQDGHITRVTNKGGGKRGAQASRKGNATPRQAKALIKAGYKLPGGKYKGGAKKGATKTRRVSQLWIKENMTAGQAGFILRLIKKTPARKSWQINNPARPFFGLTEKEINTMGKHIINEFLNATKRA
jgi:phage gpG-like protein